MVMLRLQSTHYLMSSTLCNRHRLRFRKLAPRILVCLSILLLLVILHPSFMRTFSRHAFVSLPPADAQTMYLVLDTLFTICADHGVVAFMAEGSLLGALRFGFLSPWDHDVEVRIGSSASLALYYERVLPEMDKRLGEHWSEYVEVQTPPSVGYSAVGGCSFNELLLDGQLLWLVSKVYKQWRQDRKQWDKDCYAFQSKGDVRYLKEQGLFERFQRHGNDVLASELESLVLRDPRGYAARVQLPVHANYFIRKYGGARALGNCTPDVIMSTVMSFQYPYVQIGPQPLGVPKPKKVRHRLTKTILAAFWFHLIVGEVPCRVVNNTKIELRSDTTLALEGF